jgi:DNA polymerase/3'-5' exonuclease PolX
MKSYEIAHLFERMADVLEFRGENPFRIRATARAEAAAGSGSAAGA